MPFHILFLAVTDEYRPNSLEICLLLVIRRLMSTPPRRQRATVACLSCSARKKRCDGSRPCVSCTTAGQSCVFEETGRKRKRGLLPGYVKVLEALFGHIFTNVANSEDAILQLLEDLRLRQAGEDAEHEDETHILSERWKQSRVCAAVEQKLSDGHSAGFGRSDSHPVYKLLALSGDEQGPANTLSVSAIARTASEATQGTNLQAVVLSATELSQALSVRPAWEKTSIIARSAISLMLPVDTYELVDIFFTFTSCWLPIVDRTSIFKTIDMYVQGESLILESTQKRDQHALLWAVVTYAAFQRHAAVQNPRQQPLDSGDLTLEQLMQTTRTLLELDSIEIDPAMIQAQVLISLVQCGRAEYSKGWRGIGKAIAALKSSHSIVNGAALTATRAGCFVVDTLLATHTRLPAHFRGEKIEYFSPGEVQEYEPWSNHTNLRSDKPIRSHNLPQRLFSTFSSLIKLLTIMSTFACDRNEQIARSNLTTWYNDFCKTHRHALGKESAQNVPWTPQMLNVLIVYSYVEASINGILDRHDDTYGDKHPSKEISRLYSAWWHNFGLPSTPATMTLFLENVLRSRITNDIEGMFVESRGRWLGETAERTLQDTAGLNTRDGITHRPQRMDLDELHTQFLPVSTQANEARNVTAHTQLDHRMTEAATSADRLHPILFASALPTNTSTCFGHPNSAAHPSLSQVPSFTNGQVGLYNMSSIGEMSRGDVEDLALMTFTDDFIYNLDSRQELDGQYLSNLGYVDGFENNYNQTQ